MDVKLGLLADYANAGPDGKLNIMGVFRAINASQFPHVHAQMHLVLILEVNRAELGRKKKIEIQLLNDDGAKLFTIGGEMEIAKAEPRLVGVPIHVNHILSFQNVRFEKPGNYEFVVMISDDPKGSIPLWVVKREPKQAVSG